MKTVPSYPLWFLILLILAGTLLTASAIAQSPTASAGATVAAADKAADFAALGNPAAVHCKDMGYRYEIVGDNGQRGFCALPGGEVCDAWEFLQGKCGQSHSYCAKQGYQIRTVRDGRNPFSPEYAVCVTREGVVIGSVTQLTNLSEKATGCDGEVAGREMPPTVEEGDEYVPPLDGDPPSSFDWRSYQGSDWLTPVKDQGGCGSCWAFSAVGVTESAHNIASNDPTLDKDLSEQYLVAGCSDSGTCCGGSKSSALAYIRDSGIPDESCLSYVDGEGCSCGTTCDSTCTYRTGGSCSDRTCSDRCGDWSSRLEYITSMGSVSTDLQTIKQALVDTGPLAVSMGYGPDYGGGWNGDIYRCTLDTGTNHAVVLVGYDDSGGYWWVRNSWGTGWGDNGYFKLGYGECYVEQYVYYANAGSSGGDAYEPDNTSGQASWIYDGSPQTHSIVPVGDVDWVKFTLSAESEVVIETSGTSGDTRMWLYDSGLGELEYDDDGGYGFFSQIDRLCGTDALPAGTYYVKMDEYGNDDEIPSYDITFTVVQTCMDAGPLVYDSHLIDDDSTGNSQGNDDGVVDCGETIELYVDLLNQGTDTVLGVDADISSGDPYVTWPHSTTSPYPDIAGGGTGTNVGAYGFAVAPSAPDGHVIYFDLYITAYNGGPWTESFDVPVTCVTNNPPNMPGSPSPADGATGVSTAADLSWSGGDPDAGDTVTYDVYLGTSDPPTSLLCNDVSSTTCDPGTLSYGTHYYWYVVATDNHAASTSGPVWDFTTTAGGDAYEPDNTSGQASWIYDGSPQTHSIVPVDDVDWVKFSLSEESEVVIETSGTSGDTRMWLYDSALGELEYDDDGGNGFFSQIDRLCGTDALPAGTYYVKIDEYGNDTEIPSYDITFTVVQTCPDVGPLTYDSYLIDDDNNGNSQGNDDGAADCGESIELYVDLLNQGTDAATGVDATLSTSDSYVSWLSNANSSYPDIAGGGTGTNSDDYNLLVNPSTPNGHVIHFDLNIAAGNGGPWTDSFDVPVTCVTNNPPDTPGSPSPADGATGVSTTTDLSWSGGDPDAGDAVTYDVYLGTSDPPTTLLCNDLSSTTCDPGTLSSSTHYYWYVVATDNHAASTNGPVWDFSTGSEPNNPPNTPGSPVPADGATGVSTAADLSWSGGDPDAGDTVTYDVYLGTSDPPTALLCNDVSSTTCDPGPLLYGTHYYWYVVATDNHATSTSGPVWDFSTTAGTDAYEPDNTSGQASWIYDGAPQTHSIAPVDDVDWVKFSLSAESEVVIETSGPSGDTRIWLYNSNLKELEFDDDGGSSLFSRIERLCGIDALPAGTYYVRIDEYESNDEIPSYDISFTVRQACEETYSIYLPVVERHYR